MKPFFLFVLFLGLCGYFLWPTPYVVYPPGDGPYKEHFEDSMTRISRFSTDAWFRTNDCEWETITFSRPGIFRPDLIPSSPAPRVDASQAQRQQQSMDNMSAQADQMARSAAEATRK